MDEQKAIMKSNPDGYLYSYGGMGMFLNLEIWDGFFSSILYSTHHQRRAFDPWNKKRRFF